jgi:hypothetical protein
MLNEIVPKSFTERSDLGSYPRRVYMLMGWLNSITFPETSVSPVSGTTSFTLNFDFLFPTTDSIISSTSSSI